MLEKLHVHGFRTLFETEVHFGSLTIILLAAEGESDEMVCRGIIKRL
jgi:hypothetical protein